MKHLLYTLFIASLIFSCKSDPETTEATFSDESEELARLRSENRAMKDQMTLN